MQSRFIKLTEYCLLEYQYESLSPSSPIIITSPFYKLKNSDNEIFLYNPDSALYETGNIKDLTVIPQSSNGGRFVYLDSEDSPNYTEYDTTLSETIVPGGSVIGDRVRFYMASGFQFTEVTNMVLSIRQDMNNGNALILANILLNANTLGDILLYTTRPFIIGNTLYDRYIDIIVPSIKNIDEDYYTSPNQSNTFAYQITSVIESTESNISVNAFLNDSNTITLATANSKIEEGNVVSGIGIAPNTRVISKTGNILTLSNNTISASSGVYSFAKINGVGLVRNNPITVNLFECTAGPVLSTPTETYSTVDINRAYSAQISQANDFDLVGAQIREAVDGDYLEFFATWNQGFPEEFIGILEKRTGQSWIIFHQLSIFEQIGSSFIKSGDATFFQETNFDEPLVFRPILKNANEAVSMVVDYSVRLVNRTTNEQIIRTGSLTVVNPNKYGKSLLKLDLADKPNSYKISNVIVKKLTDSVQVFNDPAMVRREATAPVVEPTTQAAPPTVITNTVTQYVPVFYVRNSISVSPKNHLVRSGKTSELTFGQGLLSIAVTPFDNTFKFQVKTESASQSRGANSVSTMDLTQFSGFELVFGSAASKITVPSITDQSQVDSSIGEILFKVNETDSARIQNLDDPKFYIVTVGKDGSRSALYTGKWYKSDGISTADTDNANLLSTAQAEARLEETVASLQTRITELETENNSLKLSSVKIKIAQPAGDVQDVPITNTNPIRTQKPYSVMTKVKNRFLDSEFGNSSNDINQQL